jgi:hypothetical protein
MATSGALTLAQVHALENRPLKKGIIQGLLEHSFLMQTIPWSTTNQLVETAVLWSTLPDSADFRDLNEGFSSGVGDYEQRQEGVYDFGTDLDVDLILTKVKSFIKDPRADQIRMQLKAIAYKFNYLLLSSARAVTPKGIDGIKVRAADLAVDDSELAIAAGGLDLSEATGRADADVHLFLDYMNRLLYRVDNPTHILTNDRGILAFESMFRRSSLFDQSKDMFGRKVSSCMGIPLVDMSVKADQTTRVLPLNFDDTTATGTSARTSMFVVSFSDDGLHGLQLQALDTREIGELEARPVLRTRLQWTWGLANYGRRSIGQLSGLYLG